MSDKLEVQIGADIKEFQSKLSQSLKGFDKLKAKEKELEKAYKSGQITADKYYDSLAKNSISLKNASARINKLKSSLSDTSGSFKVASKGAISGASAMTSFNRTIQDAPFGLMGVSNNITNLTEQFGYLKAKTGSAGGALKAMLRDLKGFGGISFAISAVTSLLLIYGDEIWDIVGANNALVKSQEAVTKALNDFYGEQVTKMNSYVKILESANTSETQRKNVTKELIKLVPSLKKEDFNYGTNLDVVRSKIGDYVLAQASRIEADTLVKENSEKLSKKARIEQIKNISDEKKRLEAFTKFLKENGERVNKEVKTSSYRAGGGKITVAKTPKEIAQTFNEFANELEEELKPIQEKINQLYGDTFSGGLDKPEPKDPSNKSTVTPLFTNLTEEYGKGLQSFNDFLLVNPLDLSKAIPVTAVNEAFNENMNQVLLNAKAKAEQFTQGIRSNLTNSFSSVFSELGSSLANGLKSVDDIIVGGLGGLLSSMGDYLIQAGTAAVIAGTVTKLFGSIAGIGAGLTAIAGGMVLKGIGAGVSSYAGAGNDNTSTSNATSSGGTSSFSGGSSSGFSSGSGSSTVVFEIAGQKLVGVLSNTLRQNKSLGGSNLVTV